MKERERKRIRSGNLKSKRNGIYARYETRFLPGFRSYRNLITRSLRLVKLRHSRGRCEISILPSCGLLEKEKSSSREREILLEKERSSSREKERCSSRFGRPFFLLLLISKYSKFAGTNGDGVRSGQEGATPSRRKK